MEHINESDLQLVYRQLNEAVGRKKLTQKKLGAAIKLIFLDNDGITRSAGIEWMKENAPLLSRFLVENVLLKNASAPCTDQLLLAEELLKSVPRPSLDLLVRRIVRAHRPINCAWLVSVIDAGATPEKARKLLLWLLRQAKSKQSAYDIKIVLHFYSASMGREHLFPAAIAQKIGTPDRCPAAIMSSGEFYEAMRICAQVLPKKFITNDEEADRMRAVMSRYLSAQQLRRLQSHALSSLLSRTAKTANS